MPDFSHLLRQPAGQAKRPPVLPVGDYTGVIKNYEIGDNNKNRTPYVRFGLVLTDWPETVDAESRNGIDLGKRSLRRDFYLTEDALWRLDEFIQSCGLDTSSGQPYEEVLPEAIGQPVKIEVQQYLNQQNNEIGNQVGKVVGLNGQ